MKKGLLVRSVKFCIISVLLWSVISCEEDSQYATGETYYKYENPENGKWYIKAKDNKFKE